MSQRPRAAEILSKLGLEVSVASDRIAARPPSWRFDLTQEADLVEEILRIRGYEEIPVVSLDRASALPKPALSAAQRRTADNRPLGRIGGGDLPTITVDPRNEKVVYSCSTVFWRTEDGGLTWSAVRGAPGGDDYQKSWVNPTNPNIILLVSDQGGVVSPNRGDSWSNWYTQPTAAMYHVTADNAFPYRLCGGQQDSGSACVDSRGMDGE